MGCPAPVRSRRGIGRAFQLTNLFPNLSVLENIRLAVQSRASLGLNLWSVWSSHRELIGRAEEVLETVALTAKRDVAASALPHGDQRKLEVAILMALEPDVFMFDEPTAGHERGRGAGDPRPDPRAQDPPRQDHPAGRAQDGRGRGNWPTGSWCCTTAPWWPTANRPQVIASPIVQEAYLGVEVKA